MTVSVKRGMLSALAGLLVALALFGSVATSATAAPGKVVAKTFEKGEEGDYVYAVTGAYVSNPSRLWVRIKAKGSEVQRNCVTDELGLFCSNDFFRVRVDAAATIDCYRGGGSFTRGKLWGFYAMKRMLLTSRTTRLPIPASGVCYVQVGAAADLTSKEDAQVKMTVEIRARP